ncbi:MAG: acyltransferase family protein [Lautropia sp.]
MTIRSLEGLRGVAALMVALFHGYIYSQWGGLPAQSDVLRYSWLFVDLFFVISGVVMAMNYGDRIGSLRDGAGFMIRRFFRLYPLHVVTTASVLLAAVLVQTAKLVLTRYGHPVGTEPPFAVPFFDPVLLLLDTFLLQGVGFLRREIHNYPSWSISVEFWLYLSFALLMLVIRPRRLRIVASVVIVMLTTGWFLYLWSVVAADLRTLDTRGLPRGLLSFFQGVLVYEIWRAPLGRWLRDRTHAVALSTLQLLAAFIALWLIGHQPLLGAWQLLIPTAFALLVLSLLPDRGVVAAGLMTRPLQGLGMLSYSIYMVHVTVLTFVDWLGRVTPEPAKHLIGGGYVAAVLALAWLTYRIVEVPWREYGKRLAARVERRETVPGASPLQRLNARLNDASDS